MKHHRYAFFGQKSAVLFDSGDQSHPYFYLRFIKKKSTNQWEKPSLQEGKSIKFNLLEMIQVINILEKPGQKWTTVHKYKNETTPITVENQGNKILFRIPRYTKPISLVEAILLKDLLKHVYQEKITNATGKMDDTPKVF